MLNPGDRALPFELIDQHGSAVTLAGLLERGPLVLYFYPADFTPGCTKEACMVRDRHAELVEAGYSVAGVSPQPAASKRRFAERHALPFPLLTDPGKRVARAYDALGPLGLYTDRVSYRIAPDGTIADAVRAALNIARHEAFIDRALEHAGEG